MRTARIESGYFSRQNGCLIQRLTAPLNLRNFSFRIRPKCGLRHRTAFHMAENAAVCARHDRLHQSGDSPSRINPVVFAQAKGRLSGSCISRGPSRQHLNVRFLKFQHVRYHARKIPARLVRLSAVQLPEIHVSKTVMRLLPISSVLIFAVAASVATAVEPSKGEKLFALKVKTIFCREVHRLPW